VPPVVSYNPNYARSKETLCLCDLDGSAPAVLFLKFPIVLPPFSLGFNSRLLAAASVVINIVTASVETGALYYFSLCKILSVGVASRGLKDVIMRGVTFWFASRVFNCIAKGAVQFTEVI
jgi:hypothetical protein